MYSSINSSTIPTRKPVMLKLERLSASLDTLIVVGPFLIACRDPIVKPITKYIILLLCRLKAFLITLTDKTMPKSIPAIKVKSPESTLKSIFNSLSSALIIGMYAPSINKSVDPDIPGRTIADIVIIPEIKI